MDRRKIDLNPWRTYSSTISVGIERLAAVVVISAETWSSPRAFRAR